jgi:hypothetical protein
VAREMPQTLEELRKKTLHLPCDGSVGVCEVGCEKMLNRFLEKLDLRDSANKHFLICFVEIICIRFTLIKIDFTSSMALSQINFFVEHFAILNFLKTHVRLGMLTFKKI